MMHIFDSQSNTSRDGGSNGAVRQVDREHYWKTAAAIIGVFTALITALTAYLGLRTMELASQRDTAAEGQSQASSEVQDLRSTNDDLEAENATLRDENTKLAAEIEGLQTQQTPASEPSTEQRDSIDPERFRGELRVADGRSIDFDHDRPRPRDPAFAEMTYQSDNRILSLHTSLSSIPAFALWNEGREPTRDECEQLLDTHALSADEGDLHQPEQGLGICIETFGENLVVFTRVVEPPSDSLVVNAVVWAEPAE